MARAERKYLAHYLDAAFDLTGASTNYQRIGKDLTEFTEEMNPDVSSTENIIGETTTTFNGYEVSSSVENFYYDFEGELEEKIFQNAMNRTKGDECKTTYVTVLLKPSATDPDTTPPTVIKAWREEVYVIPTSVGGDTSGVQIPYQINFDGNRTVGTFDLSTRKFTASGE